MALASGARRLPRFRRLGSSHHGLDCEDDPRRGDMVRAFGTAMRGVERRGAGRAVRAARRITRHRASHGSDPPSLQRKRCALRNREPAVIGVVVVSSDRSRVEALSGRDSHHRLLSIRHAISEEHEVRHDATDLADRIRQTLRMRHSQAHPTCWHMYNF